MKKFLICLLAFLGSFNLLYAQDGYQANLQFLINTDSIIENEDWFNYLQVIDSLDDSRVESILIISSASPDGNQEFNKYLSDKRAQKIVGTLQNISRDKIITKSLSEDYNSLYEVIYSSDESYRDELLYILSNGKDIKKEIQTRKYIWRNLVDNYFQPLRSARVYIKYKHEQGTICDCDTVFIKRFDTLVFVDTIYLDKPFVKVPVIAIKTNIATDALLAPNVQLEWYTYFHGISLELDYTFPWWYSDDIFVYYQILNGNVGIRKYLNNEYDGHWVGIYRNGFLYDVCFNRNKGWQGEGYGAGISYGYVWRSEKNKKLRFELFGRLGWFFTKYDTYHASDPFNGKYYYDWSQRITEFVPRRNGIHYVGPTMIGFNISYDLIQRKKY